MDYRIMIVEDDGAIREELSLTLLGSGYEVIAPDDFADIPCRVKSAAPHLILLDVNLPGTDGFAVCRQLRHESDVPIIFVTSRNTDMDELKSITLGGDDFITKPYNIPILLARIDALLGRAYPDGTDTRRLSHRGAELDLESSRVTYDGQGEDLTKNELKILAYLFRHPGKINARADIIEYLWDNQVFVDDNTLSVNITRIRAKLERLGLRDFITTRHRQGYMI